MCAVKPIPCTGVSLADGCGKHLSQLGGASLEDRLLEDIGYDEIHGDDPLDPQLDDTLG
jgi:hypothetical protein